MLINFNEIQARTVPGMNGGTGEMIGKNVYTVRRKFGYLIVRKKNLLSVFLLYSCLGKLWNYIECYDILFMLLRTTNPNL